MLLSNYISIIIHPKDHQHTRELANKVEPSAEVNTTLSSPIEAHSDETECVQMSFFKIEWKRERTCETHSDRSYVRYRARYHVIYSSSFLL